MNTPLSIQANSLSWPTDGGWLSVYSTTNLTPPVQWLPVTVAPFLSDSAWHLPLSPPTNSAVFYRLQGP